MTHVVLSDKLVPVSVEMEANVHMESGSPVQSSLLMGEESQQVLAAEADQETHSREGVSHMLLTDIFTPVCEGMQDDLSEECLTTGKKSPHEADKSQVSYLNEVDLLVLVDTGYLIVHSRFHLLYIYKNELNLQKH